MVLYHSSQQVQQFQQNQPRFENERTHQTFSSVSLDYMFHQEVVEEASKMRTHVSNASSLATSLSSSREGSPDRTSLQNLSGIMPSTASKLLVTSAPNRQMLSPFLLFSITLSSKISMFFFLIHFAWRDNM
jgi:AP2-like factor, ANT lineage